MKDLLQFAAEHYVVFLLALLIVGCTLVGIAEPFGTKEKDE